MTRNIRILAPDPAEPLFGQTWPEQAELLEAPLTAEGASVSFSPWTGDEDLSDADLVLPLLAWGYHAAPDAWIAQLDALEQQGARLANPPATLRWNTDKRYLAGLAARGLPVVPTLFFETLRAADLDDAAAQFGSHRLVAKPPISAGAHRTFLFDTHAPSPAAQAELAEALGQPTLLQPMMSAIADEGEWSLFYFAGQYSHAVLKSVASGDFRVQIQHGGSAQAVNPPKAARTAADTILAALPDPLLYARVDLIGDGAGHYLLMELELIEPQLFLEHAEDRGRAFACAVMKAAAAH